MAESSKCMFLLHKSQVFFFIHIKIKQNYASALPFNIVTPTLPYLIMMVQ